jgi:flavin reductase (DIM6/NTAB) family NADH-FMN oxidoreductase RutF
MNQTPIVDPALFKKTLSQWASGVTIVTTAIDGEPHGMTASAFLSVSLDPPLVLVSVDKRARMHAHLGATRRYGVSILARSQEPISRHFAGRPDPAMQIPFKWHDGIPLIDGAIARIVCRLADAHESGDHTLYIGRVEHMDSIEGGSPLLYFSGQYRSLTVM